MPSLKEKLVRLLCEAKSKSTEIFCFEKELTYKESLEVEADHLIAGGVTIQEWIPVAERLPDLIPCGAGTAYSEAVNVLTTGRKVITAIWDGFDWTYDAEFWDAEDEEITHWTPVLLPLPESPKTE